MSRAGSSPNGGTTVGSVNFNVTVTGTEQAKAEMAGVAAAAQQQAQAVNQATGAENANAVAKRNLSDRARDLNRSIRQQSEGFFGLVGRVTSALGVFAIFTRVGLQVADMLKSGKERADAFSASLDLTDADGSLKQVETRLASLNSQLAAFRASRINQVVQFAIEGNTENRLTTQIQQAEREAASLRATLRARENSDREADEKKVLEQLQREARRLRMTEEQALADERDRLRASLVAKIEAEERESIKNILRDQLVAIEDAYSARIANAREAAEAELALEREKNKEKERLARETAERQAATIARAITDAITQANNQLSQSNAIGNLDVNIRRLADAIRLLREQMPR